MKTEYSNIKVPLNTILGATVQALSNKNGTRLTRVTEDGRDDLVVTRPGKQTVHLPWAQVKGGFLQDGPIATGPAPRRSTDFAATGDAESDGDGDVAEDDTIRLGQPRKRKLPAGLASKEAVEAGTDIEDVLSAHADSEPEPEDDTVRLMAPKKRTRKAKP
jgi:hypothetical protein